MSNVSSERLPSTSIIERVDSGDTEDSGFGSNLVTPIDEETYLKVGSIEQRLDIANAALGYFANADLTPRMDGDDAKGVMKNPPNVCLIETTSTENSTGEREDAIGLVDGGEGVVNRSHLIRGRRNTDDAKVPFQEMNIGLESKANLPQELATRVEEMLQDSSILSAYDSSQSMPSPLPSSPEIDIRDFKTIYNLPNTHIAIKESNYGDSDAEEIKEDNFQIIDDIYFGDEVLTIDSSWASDIRPLIRSLTFLKCASFAARITLFLPWCISLSVAILLFPSHLDTLAFGTGYIDSPRTPLRRYAFWAEYGLQFITILLGLLFVVLWWLPTAGTVLIGGLLAQFCYSWHDFLVDYTVPLGEDDRQTVYLLATTTWKNGNPVNMKASGGRFFACPNDSGELLVDTTLSKEE